MFLEVVVAANAFEFESAEGAAGSVKGSVVTVAETLQHPEQQQQYRKPQVKKEPCFLLLQQ